MQQPSAERLFPSADELRKLLEGFVRDTGRPLIRDTLRDVELAVNRQQQAILDALRDTITEIWTAGFVTGLGWGLLAGIVLTILMRSK